MATVYVKPAPGGRVRQPERRGRVMPEVGDYVPLDAHYERLIQTGDVIVTEAPAQIADAPAPVDPPATPTEQKNPSNNSSRSRKTTGALED